MEPFIPAVPSPAEALLACVSVGGTVGPVVPLWQWLILATTAGKGDLICYLWVQRK